MRFVLSQNFRRLPIRWPEGSRSMHIVRILWSCLLLPALVCPVAAQNYGGTDFACVLGQEMAGYATGEVFYTSQSLGFRHSHLDSGGYSYDQKHDEKDVAKAIDFLVADERERVLLTSMVSCLFARAVYTKEHLAECLNVLGYQVIADSMETIEQQIQQKRWQLRLATGFKPEEVTIPKRFTALTTWKGQTDGIYLNQLKSAYAEKINQFGRPVQVGIED
jgi:aldehyde:ferredoxin oxidoreductase